METIMQKLMPHIEHEVYDVIRNQEQYDALTDKYSYEILVV
jgi:hypothetical protein